MEGQGRAQRGWVMAGGRQGRRPRSDGGRADLIMGLRAGARRAWQRPLAYPRSTQTCTPPPSRAGRCAGRLAGSRRACSRASGCSSAAGCPARLHHRRVGRGSGVGAQRGNRRHGTMIRWVSGPRLLPCLPGACPAGPSFSWIYIEQELQRKGRPRRRAPPRTHRAGCRTCWRWSSPSRLAPPWPSGTRLREELGGGVGRREGGAW